MDEELLEDLLCPLCSYKYNDQDRIPRMLPDCGHTFCSLCLQKLLNTIDPEGSILCPEDKIPFIAHRKSIQYFPKNFALLKVIEKTPNFKEISELPTIRISNHMTELMCKEHYKRLDIVCLDDRQRICVNCALFSKHKGHNISNEDELVKEIELRIHLYSSTPLRNTIHLYDGRSRTILGRCFCI